jgi:hypothetical protein
MMVCSKAMINVARKLEDAFGTPTQTIRWTDTMHEAALAPICGP